jgi:phthiocerol/phenolphthiocerol synthesis type-I polyketide synthase D
MKFGLMFFASSEEALGGDKYRLVLESARFADGNGFSSVWVPERHFTEFGSLYPNPAVLQAALATSTRRIRLMAGSVVAPLHHPIRITEEWAMVDNLSGGRVGISFAPGWNPDDFSFSPEKYVSRQEVLQENIRMVRHLWQGGTIEAANGVGEVRQLRAYPTPVQMELPIWLTAAGNPQTFIRAGEMGANLLAHILDQDEEQLAQKIALYREARAANGFDAASGVVTAMLHTFVGGDAARVREQARKPFCDYLRTTSV